MKKAKRPHWNPTRPTQNQRCDYARDLQMELDELKAKVQAIEERLAFLDPHYFDDVPF